MSMALERKIIYSYRGRQDNILLSGVNEELPDYSLLGS
tara:strand:+ start:1250 stop:1363 length:114 start_codon:yes stop_codon:yes gene_type:complete